MRFVVWCVQLLLAAMFLWHGSIYLFPPAEMVPMIDAMIAPALRVFIGAAEILAGIGIVLPALTRILPWLTPLAAAGMGVVAGSAALFHLTRGELNNVAFTLVLVLLAGFVAYMRWKVVPVTPRPVPSLST